MRFVKHTLAVAALGVASLFSPVSAEPLDPAQVPGDSKWVIHIDMDAIKKTATWKGVYDRLQKQPDVMPKITELEQIFNARFPDDVHGITVFGARFGEKSGVVLIDANVDRKQVEGLLAQSPKATNKPRGDYSMLSWDDKGQTKHGVFFSESKFLIGDDKDSVAYALDVLDGKAKGLKDDAALLAGAPKPEARKNEAPGILIYVAGDELAKLRQVQAKSPLLTQMKSAYIAFTEDKDDLVMKLNVTADTAESAAKMLQAAEGMRAVLGLMAAAENAEPGVVKASQIMQTAKLTTTGVDVTLEARYPAKDVPDVASLRKAEKK